MATMNWYMFIALAMGVITYTNAGSDGGINGQCDDFSTSGLALVAKLAAKVQSLEDQLDNLGATCCGNGGDGGCTPSEGSIASLQPAYQSSNYSAGGRHASAAVDGDYGRGSYDPSCAITHPEAKAWWAVSFGGYARVNSVKIWNRNDFAGERLANFVVGMTDFDPTVLEPSPDKLAVCAEYPGTSSTGDILELSCTAPVDGFYLVIQLRGSNNLQLCEVEVSGCIMDAE